MFGMFNPKKREERAKRDKLNTRKSDRDLINSEITATSRRLSDLKYQVDELSAKRNAQTDQASKEVYEIRLMAVLDQYDEISEKNRTLASVLKRITLEIRALENLLGDVSDVDDIEDLIADAEERSEAQVEVDAALEELNKTRKSSVHQRFTGPSVDDRLKALSLGGETSKDSIPDEVDDDLSQSDELEQPPKTLDSENETRQKSLESRLRAIKEHD